MLSDILSRLVETVAEQGEDMQVTNHILHVDIIPTLNDRDEFEFCALAGFRFASVTCI